VDTEVSFPDYCGRLQYCARRHFKIYAMFFEIPGREFLTFWGCTRGLTLILYIYCGYCDVSYYWCGISVGIFKISL